MQFDDDFLSVYKLRAGAKSILGFLIEYNCARHTAILATSTASQPIKAMIGSFPQSPV